MRREDASVLVVDDDPGVRKALQVRLSQAGFKVSTVSTGEDALLACSPSPPDIMILDVSMSGLDGYQVCERIRSDIDAPAMAIVFLTGTTHAGTNSCLEQLVNQAGGDYFVAKPFDSKLLVDLLDSIVRPSEVSSNP